MKPVEPNNKLAKFQNRIAESIVRFGETRYVPMVEKVIARPVITFMVFFAFFLVVIFGLLANGYVRSSFNPEIEREQVDIWIDLREGTTYDRALEILKQLQVAQQDLVDDVKANAKEGEADKVIENWYTRARRDSVIAIMKLAPNEVRAMPAKDVALGLRERIGDVPEAKNINVGYSMNNNGPDLDISVRHPDLEKLQLAIDEITEKLRTFSAIYDVSNNLDSASEELRFDLKPGAEQVGLNLGQVMQQVRQAYYGEEVQRLPRATQDVRVMVRYPKESRNSLESLKHFRVRTADGREVPLTSLVDISYGPGLKQIRHWDGLRAGRVQGYLKEPVLNDIMKELNENFFPELEKKYPGLTRAAVGEQVAEQEFSAEMIGLLGTALLAMYFVLAMGFKSYFQPAIIMVALPFAWGGAVVGHLLLDTSFSIFSFFGVVAAFGVVINDNLVLVDAYKSFVERGATVRDAIIQAGKSRFRAILITSVTTFVGLVPLMLEQSSQSAFLKPTVISLAFALVVAFFVTLFLVPALLVIGDNIVNWFKARTENLKLNVRYRKAKFDVGS